MTPFVAPHEESRRTGLLAPKPALSGEDEISVSISIAIGTALGYELVPLHLKELLVREYWGVRCRLRDLNVVPFSRKVKIVLLSAAKIRSNRSRKQPRVSLYFNSYLFLFYSIMKGWGGRHLIRSRLVAPHSLVLTATQQAHRVSKAKHGRLTL